MDTFQIEIIEPGAKRLLDDLAKMNLITVQPMKTRKAFKRLLTKMRANHDSAPSIDEITSEVETVRGERYRRRSDDQSNTGHKSLD